MAKSQNTKSVPVQPSTPEEVNAFVMNALKAAEASNVSAVEIPVKPTKKGKTVKAEIEIDTEAQQPFRQVTDEVVYGIVALIKGDVYFDNLQAAINEYSKGKPDQLSFAEVFNAFEGAGIKVNDGDAPKNVPTEPTPVEIASLVIAPAKAVTEMAAKADPIGLYVEKNRHGPLFKIIEETRNGLALGEQRKKDIAAVRKAMQAEEHAKDLLDRKKIVAETSFLDNPEWAMLWEFYNTPTQIITPRGMLIQEEHDTALNTWLSVWAPDEVVNYEDAKQATIDANAAAAETDRKIRMCVDEIAKWEARADKLAAKVLKPGEFAPVSVK